MKCPFISGFTTDKNQTLVNDCIEKKCIMWIENKEANISNCRFALTCDIVCYNISVITHAAVTLLDNFTTTDEEEAIEETTETEKKEEQTGNPLLEKEKKDVRTN